MNVGVSVGICVNGEHRRVRAGTSVAQMITEIGIDPQKVAVERNLEIVPRSVLGEICIEDGDAFEVVHFVGGG